VNDRKRRFDPFATPSAMTAICVRREKAALSSGCKSQPANAQAGSNRSRARSPGPSLKWPSSWTARSAEGRDWTHRAISDRRLAGRPGIAGSTTPFRWTKEDPARVCQRIRWTMGVAHRLPTRSERRSNRTRKATGFEANRPFQSCQSVPIGRNLTLHELSFWRMSRTARRLM
jgi:hypothetical protein